MDYPQGDSKPDIEWVRACVCGDSTVFLSRSDDITVYHQSLSEALVTCICHKDKKSRNSQNTHAL